MSLIDRFSQPNITKLEKAGNIYELFKAMHYESNFQIQKDAYEAIIRVCRGNEYRLVMRLQSLNSSEQDRIDTLNVLGEIGEYTTIEDVSGCLFEDSWRIREASAKALGNFRSDKALPALLKALKERRFFSEVVINEMKQSNDSINNDLTISGLAVQEGKVQIAIVEALVRITPKNNQQVLDDLASLNKALNMYTKIKQQNPAASLFMESVYKVEKELAEAVDKALQALSDVTGRSAMDIVEQNPSVTPYTSENTPVIPVEAIHEILDLAQNQRIEAIKRVKELTGLGLKEAVDYLNELVSNQSKLSAVVEKPLPSLSSIMEVEIRSLIDNNNRILAIQRVKQLMGCGLKDAKDYVDKLAGVKNETNEQTIIKGQVTRGLSECYRCQRNLGDGSLYHTASVFQSGSFSDMTYACKSCGKKYCLDCMTLLKKNGGICEACRGNLGW